MQEDPATGRLKTDSLARPFWKQGFASGFSWFGEAYMSAAAEPSKGVTGMRATRFRLGNHCPGNLRISASVFGRRSATDWLADQPLPAIPVKIDLIVSSGHGAKEIYAGEALATSNGLGTPVELKRGAKADFNVSLHEATGDQPWCQSS